MALGDQAVRGSLEDWRSAPISGGLRAMLGFLERLTLTPGGVTPEDVRALRAAGVDDTAAAEAMHVCFLFCLMNVLADAFGYDIPPERQARRMAHVMNAIGYRLG